MYQIDLVVGYLIHLRDETSVVVHLVDPLLIKARIRVESQVMPTHSF